MKRKIQVTQVHSFSVEMYQIPFGGRRPPGPAVELNGTLAGFRGGKRRKGTRWEEKSLPQWFPKIGAYGRNTITTITIVIVITSSRSRSEQEQRETVPDTSTQRQSSAKHVYQVRSSLSFTKAQARQPTPSSECNVKCCYLTALTVDVCCYYN